MSSDDQPHDREGGPGPKAAKPRPVTSEESPRTDVASSSPLRKAPVDDFVRRGLVAHHGQPDPQAVEAYLSKSEATYRSAVLIAGSGDFDNAVSLAHNAARHAVDALLAHRACRLHPNVRDRHKGVVDYFEAELSASGLLPADRATALARKWQSTLDARNRAEYRTFRVTDPKPQIDAARSVRRYVHLILGRDAPDDPRYP